MKRLLAFTLAETLIVMGVIGVVAALTLPNLNQSTSNKEKVVKLKKIYSNLQDALGRATAVYGPIDEWCTNLNQKECSKKGGDRITEFMKITKNCGLEKNKGCFSSKTNYASGSGSESGRDTYDTESKYILADGSSLSISAPFNGLDGAAIYVDIDGPNKGKNSYNIDIFQFQLEYDDGLIPEGSCNINDDYGSCTAWVIENGNMDYLKANSNGKCTNGTQLSETVTSCN